MVGHCLDSVYLTLFGTTRHWTLFSWRHSAIKNLWSCALQEHREALWISASDRAVARCDYHRYLLTINCTSVVPHNEEVWQSNAGALLPLVLTAQYEVAPLMLSSYCSSDFRAFSSNTNRSFREASKWQSLCGAWQSCDEGYSSSIFEGDLRRESLWETRQMYHNQGHCEIE